MLPVIGRQNRLHGSGSSFIKVQNQIGSILHQIKDRHAGFTAEPDQHIVADQEENHLIQILDRSGKPFPHTGIHSL